MNSQRRQKRAPRARIRERPDGRAGMKSEATVARYAEHRKFDRARVLFEKAGIRHKSGTAKVAAPAASPEN